MDRGSNAVGTDSNGLLQLRGRLPAHRVDGPGGLLRQLLHDRRHLPGRQPADADDGQGCRRRRQHAQIIGLSGTVDWGVQKYDAAGTKGGPRNGGIVGSISYDTTRNELDPQYAASEDWQPGIPNIPVELYAPVDCGANAGEPCDATDRYELAADGSIKQGQAAQLLRLRELEQPDGLHRARRGRQRRSPTPGTRTSSRPTRRPPGSASRHSSRGCSSAPTRPTRARRTPTSVRPSTATTASATPAPARSTPPTRRTRSAPAGPSSPCRRRVPRPDRHPEGRHRPAEVPGDLRRGHQHRPGRPGRPAGAAAGLRRPSAHGRRPGRHRQLRTVTGDGTNGAPIGITVPASTPVDNPTFADMGGSPYEGMVKPRCDTKLVDSQQRQVDRARCSTSSPTCPSRRACAASSSTTSTTRPTSATVLYGDKAGVPTSRSASTTSPTASSTRRSPTSTAYYDVLSRRRTTSTARRRPACARTCTGSSATTRASRALSTPTTTRASAPSPRSSRPCRV